ncbi:mechanosensitive ion channel family protein [Streptomyces sp. AK02-01A]|uniref:mechanosensitive ion channel family protein n=1 Tax=Streptomyces sp. AK02-01A TaxID=3028648 RepID=UPI0029B931C0|nr:mechanosensitive ion channel family protein [Streptomyces sp. AK02-01A]MDX3854137.1 mechanosensitive ion channel family protein [Streptomyces sp. AK02-01A]
MNRALTLHDLLIAGAAVLVGLAGGLVLRIALRWLGERATQTRWSGDDIIVTALRTLVPWAALAIGVSAAAAALPLTSTVGHNVNQVLIALLILSATFSAARTVAELVRSVTLSRAAVAGSATIFVNITRVTVLAIGILVLLQTLGISVAPLLTALGVGGLAVALALQDTLANLFAGVHILVSKTVQPGDYIRLSSGEDGYVVDINWRNTVVRQLSDNLVIIPNSKLASTIMTNYHRPEQQMSLLIQVSVAYSSDLDQVERVTAEVAQKVMAEVEGGVPDHVPAVRFHTFTESGVGFTVILRVLEFGDQYLIKHNFIKRLHERYRTEGIEIPVPGRTVVVRHQDEAPLPRQRTETADRAPRLSAKID